MRVLLVLLPEAAAADPALGLPLGTRRQVIARIVDLLPGTTFERGRGTFRRPSYELIFTVDGDEPTVVDVQVDRGEGFIPLKRIVEKTGWTAIDPDGPDFIDLDASRAAGSLVASAPIPPLPVPAAPAASADAPRPAAQTASTREPPAVAGTSRGSLVVQRPRTPADRRADAVFRCLLATLVASVALTLPVFAPGSSVLTARPSLPDPMYGLAWYIVFAALAGVPLFALALALAANARTRLFGLAFAAGSAAATLFVAFPGSRQIFSMRDVQMTGLLLVALAGGAHVALIALAGRALAASTLDSRYAAPAVAGFVAPWLYAGGVAYALASHETTLRMEPVLAEQRHIALTHSVDQIRTCVERYAAAHPDLGFPRSLQQLGPGGEQCVGATVAAGQDAGYRFAYAAGVPNEAGVVQIYSLCARPAAFPSDGQETLVASQRLGTRGRAREGREASDSYSCVEAYDEAVAVIQHCAVTWATAHPQSGYPSTLGDVKDCVMMPGVSEFRTYSIHKDEHRYTYIPGAPDDRGFVSGFEIYGVARATYAGADRVLADETGAVRIGHAQGLATPSDPLEDDDRKAAREKQERSRIGPQELKTRCDAGDQVSCLDLAANARTLAAGRAARGEAPDVDTIVRLYSAACESGTAPACAALGDFFSDGKVVPVDLVRAAPLLERACTLGEGEACRRFATLLRASSTQAEADYLGRRQRAVALDERGCSLGNGESCFALADVLSQGNASSRARAAGVYQESCRLGVAEACHRLARIQNGDARLFLKACARADFPECEDLNPLIAEP